MFGNGELTWELLGVPEFLLPAPFPFLPIPKGLAMEMEGLRGYRAYMLKGSTVEDLGIVYGKDREEAMEAAENIAELKGTFDAVGVVRE